MKTKAVNLYKEKFDVYVGRAGKGQDGYFGNPYKLDKNTTREEVIKEYIAYFYYRLENDKEFKLRVLELNGKILGCFCLPQLCHASVIADYLNNDTK